MNSKSVLAIVSAIALGAVVLVPSVASAEDHDSYFALKFGPYFPSETNALTAISGSVQNWPTKYEVDGAIGHYWGIFGLQLSAGYLTTGTSDADFKTWPVLLTAKVRLPLGFIAPYGEGGAGVGISSVNVSSTGSTSTKAGFAGIAGAGVDFYLGQFLLGAEFKYLWLDPGFSSTGAGSVDQAVQSFKFNGIVVQAYLGYMW
ncbi:MAG TPA: outer membrane beta-barrel protein [Myxococcaceae bacterium]|nr:outer membrane beta-barrel protein [Myxococcaceae bacterium]